MVVATRRAIENCNTSRSHIFGAGFVVEGIHGFSEPRRALEKATFTSQKFHLPATWDDTVSPARNVCEAQDDVQDEQHVLFKCTHPQGGSLRTWHSPCLQSTVLTGDLLSPGT
eukprot:581463-Pelagomonas_calceolata.AAC.3